MPQEGQLLGGLPGKPDPGINFPENARFVVFEQFETLNTKPPRPAIKDSEMAWCDGFMPFGPSNLRTLYGVGGSIYTAPTGKTITGFWFFNFDDATYAAVMLSDGSVLQVATDTGITKTILSAGTLDNPDPHNTSVSQWNSKYLILVSSQTNGYWIWDGAHLFKSGGVAPETSVTNSGLNYTSQPTFHFQSTASSFTSPTFTATLKNKTVTEIDVVTPGSGFAVDDYIMVSLAGGGSDTTARATATISANSGPITDVVVLTPGYRVSSNAALAFSGGGGTGAAAVPQLTQGTASYEVQSVTVIKGGSGYTSEPTVLVQHSSGNSDYVAPTFQAVVSYGEITGVSLLSGGSGYKTPPTITVIGDGQNAQLQAHIDSSGAVTSIEVLNGGYGYTKALIVFSGGNNAAECDVHLMPFGIQGTTVETYVNRMWVGDTRKGYFTAPSTVSDFTPSNGAGVFRANDAFQRVAYHAFRQTNGFLYLISDSSVNYVGGVQTTQDATTGSSSTIFNNLNVDPQIGTPWPSTVQLFSRNIVFANSFGIFVSYGGAVTKISMPLDGIYNTVVTPGSGNANIYPSSAVASLFGIAVYMLLFPIIDPYTGQQVNKLLMWDGTRWWTSNQDVSLTYISSQEINSFLTAWGTDGKHLYPLFQTPTTNMTKVVQSKLWANPSYWFIKSGPELAGLLNFYQAGGTVNITLDTESGSGAAIVASSSGSVVWTNNTGSVAAWTNNVPATATWGAPGLSLIPPTASGQVGTLMGMTISTNAEDLAVLSMAILQQNYSPKA